MESAGCPETSLHIYQTEIHRISQNYNIHYVSNKKLSSRRHNVYCKQTMQKTLIILVHFKILGDLISFLLSNYPSVCQHGTTRLPLKGFSRSLVLLWIFRKSIKNIQPTLQFYKITDILQEDQFTFIKISRWYHFRMRKISAMNFKENQNTQFIFTCFRISWHLCHLCHRRQHNTNHALCVRSR